MNITIFAAEDGGSINGSVRTPQNIIVIGAKVSAISDTQVLISSVITDEEGNYKLLDLPVGSYEIVVEQNGFATYRKAIRIVTSNDQQQLDITLTINQISEGVTVTAVINEVEDIFESPQQVNIVTSSNINDRPVTPLPQIFREEVGLSSRQTSPQQGTINIRGLSSQRIVTLIDGVRFNNSFFEQGPNQYLGLIDSSIAQRIEVVHGPGSAQYGSDSLGGTVNVLSEAPRFTTQKFEVHGRIASFFGSADRSVGGDAKISIGGPRFSLLLSGFGRRVNELRTGQGIDSHSGVTLYLGLPSRPILGDRLPDTGFNQYGGFAKFIYKLPSDQQLSVFYHRSEQQDGNIYFLLNGGAGFSRAGNTPQTLNFVYGRYEKKGLGVIDSLSGTFSLNSQRNDQNIQVAEFFPTTNEFRRANAFGYELQATTHIGSYQFLTFGGEIYDEDVKNRSLFIDPLTQQTTEFRGSFPTTNFRSYAAFIQDSADLFNSRLSLNGGVRYSAFFFKSSSRDNPLNFNGQPAVLDSSIRTDNLTFNIGASLLISDSWSLNGTISRGFRAPNVVDLGSLGFNANSVEVTALAASQIGAEIGSTPDRGAQPTGKKLRPLTAENLFNYEIGTRVRGRKFYSTFSFFYQNLNNFISKRAVILPQGAVGKSIDTLPIVAQDPQTGVVFFGDPSATFLSPIIATVNATDIRLYGIEASTKIFLRDNLVFTGNVYYLRGEDKNPAKISVIAGQPNFQKTKDAPDIIGGLPPMNGFISLRYQLPVKRLWIETYSHLSSFQDRYSGSDIAEPQISGFRSRDNIGFFFFGGARRLGLISNGQDGLPFTFDDTLSATGETLTQLQDRLLGRGVLGAPTNIKTPGYATFNIRGGYKLGERSELIFILENILDKNYRIHGSSIDAPGRNLVVRYSWSF